ncbi:MAG: substrate-binding domain-containing protein [Rhodospirillales bacterium]|jgi:ribose transport system substrate-binding protein|tara:strand:+ start:347 stop:1270 length:924 start_codon:yes stop_codon:yes gene_type:complete
MRKLLFLLFALLLIASTSENLSAKTIGVSLSSDTNPFYIAMLKGIKMRAAKAGYKISVVNAEEDIAKQLNGVNDLIAKGVDGILISPIDAKALCSVFSKAKAANIPMMSIARGSACKDQLLHVGLNELKIGQEIAAWTAKKIGGKGKIAMLAGPAGAQAFINFAKGYAAEMAKHSGIKIVLRREMLLTRENGLKNGEDALVAHPDLKAIYGANDELGMGAAQAVAAAGKTKSIVVTGMNGIPPAVAAVNRGFMDLTVGLSPFAFGNVGVDTMVAKLSGKGFGKKVLVGYKLIDKANAKMFIRKKKKK